MKKIPLRCTFCGETWAGPASMIGKSCVNNPHLGSPDVVQCDPEDLDQPVETRTVYRVVDRSFPEVTLSEHAARDEAQSHADWCEAHGGGAFYGVIEAVVDPSEFDGTREEA